MVTRATRHGIRYVNAAPLGKIHTLRRPRKMMLHDTLMNGPDERRRDVRVIDGSHHSTDWPCATKLRQSR